MSNNNKTSPWVWIGLGCGAMVVGSIAFGAFIVFIVFGALRSSQPYQDGLRAARADARVTDALGTPIKPGWLMTGSIKTVNDSGSANIMFTISGPKSDGAMRVIGTKADGHWTYTVMQFRPRIGRPIDLPVPPRTTTPGG